MGMKTLHLFFGEVETDRWVPLDRYPRRWLHQLRRPPVWIGGPIRAFLNLRAGLDRLRVRYRVNDYAYIQTHSEQVACIFGPSPVLDKMPWRNPILFGTAVFSHPSDDPDLFSRLPVRRVLVPGPWMEAMCRLMWGDRVTACPAGIDTDRWAPRPRPSESFDLLLYDKVLWEREHYEKHLLAPIRAHLRQCGVRVAEVRYGFYREEDFRTLVQRSRAMIFLCPHETQGIAYLQVLSCGVPILAWDEGGFWKDPAYFPHRVKFSPVSSVPYWDARCGRKFKDADGLAATFPAFWEDVQAGAFRPRDYVLEHLTLEKCAQRYVDIWKAVA